MQLSHVEMDEDEELFRRYCLCEEERLKRYPNMAWSGGYRWFRSANVIALEQYQSAQEIERIRQNLRR